MALRELKIKTRVFPRDKIKMRYIDTGCQIIPKHCIYGPRNLEGIVLNNFEWWRITNHLIKEQKEKNIVAFQKAKEEAKKDVSFQMTKNWSNTLAVGIFLLN